MESYNATEVDRYPNDICPFNETHRLHSLKHFEGHLLRCKDQYFPEVFKCLCRYNPNHIFVNTERKTYHEPRCEGHPLRLEKQRSTELPFGSSVVLPKYQVCPYYPYHLVLIAADAGLSERYLDSHILTCPRKAKPLPKENIDPSAQLPLVPFAPSLRQMPNPGLDLDLEYRLKQERLILHYNDRPFCTRVTYTSRDQLPDKHIYLDGIISSTSVQFPGLLERKDHTSLLVGKLNPDSLDKPATSAFWAFYGLVENAQSRKLAVSYQDSSSQDRIWIIAPPSESSGFGSCLAKGDLGLFVLKHSEMLKTPSVLCGLQMRVDYLGTKLQEKQVECMEKEERMRDMSTQLNARSAAQFLREAELKHEIEAKQEQMERLVVKQQLDQQAVLREFDQLIQTHQEQSAALLRHAEAQKQAILQTCEDRLLHKDEEYSVAQKAHDEMAADLQRRLSEIAQIYEERLKKAEMEKCEMYEELQVKTQMYTELSLEVQNQRKPKGKAARASKKSRESSKCGNCEQRKCQECGEHQINTIFTPCGHMVYCNLCLANRKIDLNTSLLHRMEPEFCPRCNEQIKKIRKAFCPHSY